MEQEAAINIKITCNASNTDNSESSKASKIKQLNMAKTPPAFARATVDYSSKAKAQGLRLVPDPDQHILPSHVPATVSDPVAECIAHSKQVVQRGIDRREKRLVSKLGAAWDLNKSPKDGPYFLQCARSNICDGFEYVYLLYKLACMLCSRAVIAYDNSHGADAKTSISCASRMACTGYIAVLLAVNTLNVRQNKQTFVGNTGGFGTRKIIATS